MHELPGIMQSALAPYEISSDKIQEKLAPTLTMVNRVYEGVVTSLSENGIKESDVRRFLYDPEFAGMTEGQRISVFGRDLARLAHEYDHVRKVMAATMEFKRTMYVYDLPDRVVVYQTGTGWPLPNEQTRCRKVAYIKYGTGALSEFSPPGTKKDAEAGAHLYEMTADSGEKFTFIALKGRMHAYNLTNWDTAPHELAFMPRLLKGIGAEFILSTFASGADPSLFKKGIIRKHDLAVIVASGDESHLVNTLGPGTGDQRILATIFGGAFKNIAKMLPESADISLFQDAVRSMRQEKVLGRKRYPRIFPVLEFDTYRSPNFQDVVAQAIARGIYEQVKKLKKLSRPLLTQFGHLPLALTHGMVQLIEREGYFQSWDIGLDTLFNRRLRELAVCIFTDLVDTGVGGQSSVITDEAVKKAGKEAEQMASEVVTRFMMNLINTI